MTIFTEMRAKKGGEESDSTLRAWNRVKNDVSIT